MAEKKKPSLLMRFKGLILLALTGGLGGMELSDYPILSRVVNYLKSDTAGTAADSALRSQLVTQIEKVAAKQFDPYARAGIFEVKVERVSLSDVEYEAGRTIDLQVRVARIRGGRTDGIVWDSRKLGANKRVVGKDELTAGWGEKPFQVDWKPGDRYLLEVWDCSGRLKFTKLFVLDRTGRSDEFPLRPATVALTLRADGEPVRDPDANELVVTGKPVNNAKDGASEPKVAEADPRSPLTSDPQEGAMPHRMSVDRFEGKDKQIAVLVGEDDAVLNVPRVLLPDDVQAGDVVTLTIARDAAATKALVAETKALQAELKATDPGGDLSL